jgi:tol-pal system protein YbgF
MTRTLWAVAVLLVLTGGCATGGGNVRQLQAEVGTLRAELASLQQAHEQYTRDAATLRASVRALEGEVSSLRGALAETSKAVRQLTGRLGSVEDGVKSNRADSAARPASVVATTPPPAPAERPARDGAARDSVPRAAAVETAYQAALAAFRAREYGQAVLDFLDFLVKYPKHSLAANAQYWIGEAYYIQRDWRQSLTEFQRVLDHNPSNGRAAETLLKIGLCHANLREAARARIAWQRVVQEHPDSEAAAKARNLLAASRGSVRR